MVRDTANNKTKSIQDFDLSPPSSLREMIQDELEGVNFSNYQRKKPLIPTDDDSINTLLERLYEKIQREALAVYKTDEVWALKAWAFSHIFKDAVCGEVTEGMVEELMSPVAEHSSKGFDPMKEFRNKLIADGRPDHTIRNYMRSVSRFVSKAGKKRHYSDSDVRSYMAEFRTKGYIKKTEVKVYYCPECDISHRKNGHKMLKCPECHSKLIPKDEVTWEKVPYKSGSICAEYARLFEFLKCINGRDYIMPIASPDNPDDELFQPMLSDEDVERLIFNCLFDKLPPDWIARLAVSTLYGGRVSELADISSKDVHLDGENSTIYIRTRKHGERKSQPLPEILLPLFEVPINSMPAWKLQRVLKRMCQKAGVELPKYAGWHALRRRAVTSVYEKTSAKELPIMKFFRWSTGGRQLGQLPTYVRTNVDVSDRQLLAEHPIMGAWKIVVPYLVSFHPKYQALCNDNKRYHTEKGIFTWLTGS